MRIALLSHAPVKGGSTDLFLQTRDFFRSRGHVVQGIFGQPAQPADPRTAEEWIVPIPRGDWRARIRAYRDRVESFAPDLVYAISGRDEADLFRFLPYVRVRHISSLEETEYFNVPYTLRHTRRFLEAVTANTPDALEQVERISGRPGYLLPYLFPEPLRQLGGIDDSRVRDARRPLEIAFVSRLERFQKRTHWLPRIIRLCEGAGVSFHWHCYGDGPGAERLRRTLAGRPDVFFHGWVDRATLYERLPGHDIFFLCSRWEGLPIAMVEAMRCGLAPVVPDIPAGMRWTLRHGGGWLYHATSPAAAARALVTAARDREVLVEKRREARALAEKLFSPDVARRQFLELEAGLQQLIRTGDVLDLDASPRFRAVSVPAYAHRLLTELARTGPGT
jgi:glycosyltransferase involved in cell wall biosynthesis